MPNCPTCGMPTLVEVPDPTKEGFLGEVHCQNCNKDWSWELLAVYDEPPESGEETEYESYRRSLGNKLNMDLGKKYQHP